MRLYEYQAKRLLAERGVPVPAAELVCTTEQAWAAATRLGGRVAVKAQVLEGGRGKAGLVALAEDAFGAQRVAARILARLADPEPAKHQALAAQRPRVLVERAVPIAAELYLGLVLDRSSRRMLLVASAAGGVEIEETARTRPDQVLRLAIDPFLGLRAYQITGLARAMGLARAHWPSYAAIVFSLYGAAQEHEATLAEVNPLVVTPDGEFVALDAKMVVDDYALPRHPGLAALREEGEESQVERRAREAGISYVALQGRIGCMVNGAGLAMATMDLIKLYGGEPANFLDIGGGARADRVATALGIILGDPRVSSVLINIFGGITRCDEVAKGLLEAMEQMPRQVPLVVRLVGTNELEGRSLLEHARVLAVSTLCEGAAMAVAAAGTSAAPSATSPPPAGAPGRTQGTP